MWLLVIMCALAVMCQPAGAAGDDSDGQGNTECFIACVPRCQQLVKITPSRPDCDSMCENICGTLLRSPLTSNTQHVLGRRPRARRRSRSPTLREASIIARSVGLDLGSPDPADTDVRDSGHQLVLRLDSLIPDEDSLAAQVSWDAAPSSSATTWYLVTWETQGGGVRGNLLTNSTSASLSLWPDAVYHLQVSASGLSASSCLEVDTHSLVVGHVAQGPTRGPAWRVEDLWGVAAAVLVFLGVVSWRCRRRPSKPSGSLDCDYFTLYPPPVTLRHSPPVTSQPLTV